MENAGFLSGFSPIVECFRFKVPQLALHPPGFAAIVHNIAKGPLRAVRFAGTADSQMAYI